MISEGTELLVLHKLALGFCPAAGRLWEDKE